MTWNSYPADYRAAEVRAILAAVRGGESVSVVGLSGAGKSNLLGFLANRQLLPDHRWVLVDANRLAEQVPAALFRLMRRALGDAAPTADEWDALELATGRALREAGGALTFALDRLDDLAAQPDHAPLNGLRALRDAYKYQLTFVTGTRRPLPAQSEFAELAVANTLWLGPLSESDARWNVHRYAARKGLAWDETVADRLIALSWGYPSLLRGASEALAAGAGWEEIASHPAVQARVAEFWADGPGEDELRRAGLWGHPLLAAGQRPTLAVDTAELTAKEALLLEYFLAHPNQVCDKETLIQAVWPEDRIYDEGVRDSSLAQLVRRLRQKIELAASDPRFIQTVPGRGYLFRL